MKLKDVINMFWSEKYKVGDIVMIRKDLIPHKAYDDCNCTTPMAECRGKITKILMVPCKNRYFIDKDLTSGFCFYWAGEMFKKIDIDERE
jgi:hypothetical protein